MTTKFDNNFRNKANRIRIKPADETWFRLERRLDRRNSRSLAMRVSTLAVAAVFLILMAYLAFIENDKKNTYAQLPEFSIEDFQEEASNGYETALMSWARNNLWELSGSQSEEGYRPLNKGLFSD